MAKSNAARRDSARVISEIGHSGMAEVSLRVLMMALDLGWDATELRGQVQLSREHEGSHVVVMIPTNQRSIKEQVGKSWMRKVLRYADPIKMAFMQGAVDDWSSTDPVRHARGEKALDSMRSTQVWKDPTLLRDWITPHAVTPAPEPEPTPESEPEVEEQPTPVVGEVVDNGPTVSKIRPWIARRSMHKEGGEIYESKAVLERKWTDGSLDYQCAFPGCDSGPDGGPYTAPEARTIASHYGGKHGKEAPTLKAAQAESWTDPGISWTPTQRQQGRIARLTAEILAAVEAVPDELHGSNEEIASTLAQFIVKRRDAARESLTDESTPLTSEQVIERVRRLVDGGAYADLLARMEQVEVQAAAKIEEVRTQLGSKERGMTNAIRAMEARLDDKDKQIAEAEAKVAEAQRAEREANERWVALRELVNGP